MAKSATLSPPEIDVPGRRACLVSGLQVSVTASAIEVEASDSPPQVPRDGNASGDEDVREWEDTIKMAEPVDFERDLHRSVQGLVGRIEQKLVEDYEDLDEGDHPASNRPALRPCLAFIGRLAPHIALVPRLKTGGPARRSPAG